METVLTSPTYTGTQVNYYFVCKRKLWLFSRDISMEHESDAVLVGKLVSKSSYEREDHEVAIDDRIVLDFVNLRDGIIHEVKRSDKVDEAHTWQVLYYLYYLKGKGVNCKGEIDYPLLKRKETVELTEEKEVEMKQVLYEIHKVISQTDVPPKIAKKFCQKCSYFELCWS